MTNMYPSIRSRLMLAALIFALAWALAAAIHSAAAVSFTLSCMAIGSAGLAYLIWEYHRAWRLRPSSAETVSRFKNWPGPGVHGWVIRPEYISAGFILLLCAFGMYKYLEVASRPPLSNIPQLPPSVTLPSSRPLQ